MDVCLAIYPLLFTSTDANNLVASCNIRASNIDPNRPIGGRYLFRLHVYRLEQREQFEGYSGSP